MNIETNLNEVEAQIEELVENEGEVVNEETVENQTPEEVVSEVEEMTLDEAIIEEDQPSENPVKEITLEDLFRYSRTSCMEFNARSTLTAMAYAPSEGDTTFVEGYTGTLARAVALLSSVAMSAEKLLMESGHNKEGARAHIRLMYAVALGVGSNISGHDQSILKDIFNETALSAAQAVRGDDSEETKISFMALVDDLNKTGLFNKEKAENEPG